MDSLTSLRYRHGKSDPDVPVDVDYEIEQHLNDPNWDISSRTTVDTLELGEKKKAYNSDDDATSMASSREVGSRMAFQAEEYVPDLRCPDFR